MHVNHDCTQNRVEKSAISPKLGIEERDLKKINYFASFILNKFIFKILIKNFFFHSNKSSHNI